MAAYYKLIGGLVGAVAGGGVALGLPEELATPEMQGAITMLLVGLTTYFAPANRT